MRSQEALGGAAVAPSQEASERHPEARWSFPPNLSVFRISGRGSRMSFRRCEKIAFPSIKLRENFGSVREPSCGGEGPLCENVGTDNTQRNPMIGSCAF